jgi:hypothetical protein
MKKVKYNFKKILMEWDGYLDPSHYWPDEDETQSWNKSIQQIHDISSKGGDVSHFSKDPDSVDTHMWHDLHIMSKEEGRPIGDIDIDDLLSWRTYNEGEGKTWDETGGASIYGKKDDE